MIRFILCLCALYVFPCALSAQQVWEEHFSTTHFLTYPNWWGMREKFVVTDQSRLLLADPSPAASNTAMVFSKQTVNWSGPVTWELDLVFPFDPSSANHVILGLSTDLPAISGFPEGIYLQVGGQTGADFLELFEWQHDAKRIICQMPIPWTAPSELPFQLRVDYQAGYWVLKACSATGVCDEVAAADYPVTMGQKDYFLLHCRYSPSRNRAISFDHIRIEGLIPDVEAPRLHEVLLADSLRLDLIFSEPVLPAQAWLYPDSTTAFPLSCPDLQPHRCQLLPSEPLRFDTAYRLVLPQIADGTGNALRMDTLLYFARPYIATPGDLVFTEIMADPDPSRGLPQAEYLEVFNRRSYPLRLKGWQLQVNQRQLDLPDELIPPQSYRLLYPDHATGKFEAAPYPGIPNFPAIPNNGAYLALRYQSVVIDALEYAPEWYRGVPAKGVSLEKKDLDKPGNCPENWAASTGITGGSPARANPQTGYTPADSLFYIEMVYPTDACCLEVRFSQQPGEPVSDFFQIDPPLDVYAMEVSAAQKSARLYLSADLSPQTPYLLQVPHSWVNCIGAPLRQEETYPFGKTYSPQTGELLFHEILFDPKPGCPTFVELYNPSNRFLDLSGLLLRSYDPSSATYRYSTLPPHLMLAPDSVLVISAHTPLLQSCTPATLPYNSISGTLPGLSGTKGSLSLWSGEQFIDSIAYDADWHHPFLTDTRGVSLEKIRPELPGVAPQHWQSAPSQWGYATPGFRPLVRPLTLPPSSTRGSGILRISPDGDGVDDFLYLPIEARAPGSLYDAAIFSWDGTLIRELVQSASASVATYLRWDGDDQNGQLLPRGLYLLRIAYFDPGGSYELVKKTCLLW